MKKTSKIVHQIPVKGQTQQVDISDLESGVYYYELKSEFNTKSGKIILQK